jgi:hypothetical protein
VRVDGTTAFRQHGVERTVDARRAASRRHGEPRHRTVTERRKLDAHVAARVEQPAQLALQEAASLARRFGAELTLIHVFRPPATSGLATDMLAPAPKQLVEDPPP